MEGKERPGEIPWAEMSDAQLKEALVRRGLNTDGSTEQIIQRLRDYDSSHAQKKENPSEETDQGLQTEEDLLQTEGENEIIMMTDEEIQEIIDQPEVDMSEESKEKAIDKDSVIIIDEVEETLSEQNEDNLEIKQENSDTEEESSGDSKTKTEGKTDNKEKESSSKTGSKDKKHEKDKPILMKNRMLYGYLCCTAVKSLMITPFKKELMAEEDFTTWLDQAKTFHIRKTEKGTSAVFMKFATLDQGDSACCALKSTLAQYEVEVYHPNKDIFSSSRNSWTNLIKEIQNPQETLFNRLLILENIPETHNSDEKLCELFPGAIDVVGFQFDPGCSGIAVVEFFDIQDAVEFLKKTEGQIEIEGKKIKVYKYDKRHQEYAKLQQERSDTAKQKEIPPLSDDERKQMTEEYKATKTELENLQNSTNFFAAEKVSRFVELDNKVNDMVRILTNDTTRRFSEGATDLPEGEENMLTCVRNTVSKMQNKINTAKAKGTYISHEGGGSSNRNERFPARGRGGGRGGNRRFSREGSPSFRSRFSGNGGWRTMSHDRRTDDYRDGRGVGHRERSPRFRRDRSPGFREGGRAGYGRRDLSPAFRRNRSPEFRRDRSPYRREGRGDYGGRGWSPVERRGRSPGGYRRDPSPHYRERGWSPDYRQDYSRPRSPMYSKPEDKDFRNKAEGANPTSKVLQEFTAVLADKVRSLEQLQQQTLQAQLLQGAQAMGNNPMSMGNMAPGQGFGGGPQGNMYNQGFNAGPGGRM